MTDDKLPLAKVIDYLNFFLALDALQEWRQENPYEASELVTEGIRYARRYQLTLIEGLDIYLAPVMDDSIILRAMREMKRGGGESKITNLHKGARTLLARLQVKQKLQTIADGDDLTRLRILAKASIIESPVSRLNQQCRVIHRHLRKAKSWISKVADAIHAGLTDDEKVAQAAVEVKEVAEELSRAEKQAEAADPGSPDGAAHNLRASQLAETIQEIAERSPDPATVKAVAAVERARKHTYATEIGKQLGMDPDQEAASLAEEKAIIGAGAGSGKTRVLAGMVVRLIKEEGIKSDRIIATSFSRKSANELKERVLKYGGEGLLDAGDDGFGTTHSVALKLLRQFDPSFSRKQIMSSDTYLIKMAMAQVMMVPARFDVAENPEVVGMFDGLFKPDSVAPQPLQPAQDEAKDLLHKIFGGRWGLMGLGQWAVDRHNANWGHTLVSLAEYILDNDHSPSSMSPRAFKEVLRTLGTNGARNNINRNRSIQQSPDELIEIFKKARGTNGRMAGRGKGSKNSPYWKTPANQWFNLGIDKMADSGGRAVGVKRFGTAISKYRANLITPSQAWAEDKSVFAAVYGAYDWLKQNDPANANQIDFDDMLIDTCKLLISNPRARALVQAKFTHVLVDEAQDLNKAQHLLFGLITGYYDPETREPNSDGSMKAKSFVFIGDDKQCLAEGTPITMPDGSTKPVESLSTDTQVLSFRNGELKPQTVRHLVESGWTWGYEVTMKSGRTLTMSPTHKLWATGLSEHKHTIQLTAHSPKGTLVEGPEVEAQWFSNYRKALTFAEKLSKTAGLPLSQHISSPVGSLRMVTTSELLTGMDLISLQGSHLEMDTISSIQKVEGLRFFDIDVDDASNMFASGVLVSNSIYEFRGAEPDLFIEKSDSFDTDGKKGDFKTYLLEMNYRSGSDIVDAANKLIAHNTKQIPMVCKANTERKGTGLIHNVVTESHAAGAAYAADQIEEMINAELGSPDDFGVAVRTNAEAYAYGVELLKRGIPFRSKISFFNDATTRALVYWLRLAGSTPGDTQTVNEVVLNAYTVPRFNLNREFEMGIQRAARGRNYLDFLATGGWRDIYEDGWRNTKYVLPYTEALEYVQNLSGSPQEILNEILRLQGAEVGGERLSVVDALIERIKGSPDAMDLLAEESEHGDISEDAIRGLALAPIEPLMSLIGDYQDIGPALTYVEKLQRANDKTHKKDDPDAADFDEPAVVIDTCHGWKGLEAKHVFIPMAYGVFPHKASMGDEKQMASERRLAYVALTRGEDSVTVINPLVTHHGQPVDQVSQFVEEACISPLGAAKRSSRQASIDWDAISEGISEMEDMTYEWAMAEDPLVEEWDSDLSDPLLDDLNGFDYEVG